IALSTRSSSTSQVRTCWEIICSSSASLLKVGVGFMGHPKSSLTYCGPRLQPPAWNGEKCAKWALQCSNHMVNLGRGATVRWAMLQPLDEGHRVGVWVAPPKVRGILQ